MKPELRAEILNDTLNHAPSAAAAFSFVAFISILTGFFSEHYLQLIRGLSVAIIIINLMRLWLASAAKRPDRQEALWPFFRYLTALNGLFWGVVLGIAAYDDQVEWWGLVTAFTVYTAFCNASIFTRANNFKLHASFLLGISLPMIGVMLVRHQQTAHNFYLVLGLFTLVVLIYCLSQGRSFRKNVILRWETGMALINSQKALIEQRAMTEHVNRLSSIGEMAAGFAHEINNPLAIVIGNLEILESELQDRQQLDEQTSKIIKKTITSASRIAKIIKALRTLSRASSREGRTTNSLASILEDTLVLFDQRIVTQNIKLNIDNKITEDLICDPIQIGQVLVNLLGNACDEIATQGPGEHSIDVRAYRTKELNIIEVINSGPAVSDAIKEKIFTPFFTTKQVGQGMGLGLVISRSIAHQHDGNLEVDNKTGKTRFTLTLPV